MNAATLPKSTNRQQRRAKARRIMDRALSILNMSEQQYGDHLYEAGLIYLGEYTNGNMAQFQAQERSRIFWNWWKNQWTQREEEFVTQAWRIHKCDRVTAWEHIHDPYLLAAEITPHGPVIEKKRQVMVLKMAVNSNG